MVDGGGAAVQRSLVSEPLIATTSLRIRFVQVFYLNNLEKAAFTDEKTKGHCQGSAFKGVASLLALAAFTLLTSDRPPEASSRQFCSAYCLERNS
jgi:hypothetical protein